MFQPFGSIILINTLSIYKCVYMQDDSYYFFVDNLKNDTFSENVDEFWRKFNYLSYL